MVGANQAYGTMLLGRSFHQGQGSKGHFCTAKHRRESIIVTYAGEPILAAAKRIPNCLYVLLEPWVVGVEGIIGFNQQNHHGTG